MYLSLNHSHEIIISKQAPPGCLYQLQTSPKTLFDDIATCHKRLKKRTSIQSWNLSLKDDCLNPFDILEGIDKHVFTDFIQCLLEFNVSDQVIDSSQLRRLKSFNLQDLTLCFHHCSFSPLPPMPKAMPVGRVFLSENFCEIILDSPTHLISYGTLKLLSF